MTEANRQQDEQLLTAYLDGELGLEQRALAESLIQENSEYARLVEEWRENGIALRGLPKHQLDAGFSERVLAATEIVQFENSNLSSTELLSQSKHSSLTQASPTQNPLNGLVAIAALAAMVLLTLFVFPMFADPSPVAKVDPIVEKDKTETKRPDVTNPGANAQVAPPIQRVERGMTLSSRGPVGVVDPISTFNSNLPAVEQVFWIKLDSQQSLASLQKALADNAIKIVDSEKDFSPSADVSAIYVVATSLQMRKAIGNLSNESDANVTAFPLPLSAIQNGKAHQILPIHLTRSAEQANEIAELDRWFGLSDDDDDARPIRFLLLVGGE